MNGILSLLLDIFRQPSVIVALISLIGLAVQHKKGTDIMKGTIRTLVGFLVLAAGASVVSGALVPFGDMFQHAFHVQGVVPNNEAIVGTVLVKYGSEAALIFFFGMIVNVLLSMTSRFKYIYLSGHVAFYMATMVAVIFEVAGFPTWGVLLWGSIAQGLIVTISPALVQPFMKDATGTDGVALGHTGGAGSVLQAATFSAGVFIILAGVRVVLGEIVPAFKGISEKLVKNAVPALDVPMTFTFAPNAVLIGFISSFVGGLIGMGIMILAGTTIIIPGIVAHFMTGGATGVIGNGQGGRRGAIIGSFVNGLAITFLPLFLLPVLGDMGLVNSTYSDADFGVAGILLGCTNQLGGQTALVAGVLIAVAVFYLASFLLTRRDKAKQAAQVEA